MCKRVLILFLYLLFFEACSSSVSVKISNMQDSNLNSRLDNVPVTLIVYKLNNIEKFKESSDRDLITREDGVLGRDKIDSIKLQIAPNDEIAAVKVNDDDVPYIGVLVLFADETKKTTKIWVETKNASGSWINFEITREGVKQIQ